MISIDALRDAILSQNPTDEQKDAIFADELEFLLRAAPGSGKTWTSSRRFIWRGANWPYSSGGLALLSFTNAAIREFKEATITLGRSDILSDPNYVGTFDAFVERFILTPFGHLITGDSQRPKFFLAPRPGDWKNNKLLTYTKMKGNRTIPVPAWETIPFPQDNTVAYKASSTFGGQELNGGSAVMNLMLLGFYTHSQRVFWACHLLFKRPHIVKVIARRFPEIIIDEAQDTNAWLLILLDLLREKGAKITLVGDPDQCIYEFSMADATSLPSLRDKWNIPEKPLSQSFRCNNQIASAVKMIGGNDAFCGYGDGGHEYHRAYIIRESSKQFSDSIRGFQSIVEQGNLDIASAAIICRAHGQLESVRGEVKYSKLKGKTKILAKAAFLRDCRYDYEQAYKLVEAIIREMAPNNDFWERMDENPDSENSKATRLAIWQYVKSPKGLPAVSQHGGVWIQDLRQGLTDLMQIIGIGGDIKIGKWIKKTGLDDAQMNSPLFAEQNKFPSVRQDTIHQVKGESIDAVLAVGSLKFWNSVVKAIDNDESTENRRIAYVAMTRARHLLVVALPSGHFDKHLNKWEEWGFKLLPYNNPATFWKDVS